METALVIRDGGGNRAERFALRVGHGPRTRGEAGLSSARDEVLLDLKERARFYASLTELGLPRAEVAPAPGISAPCT